MTPLPGMTQRLHSVLTSLAESVTETFLQLAWRHSLDDDPLVATRYSRDDLESGTWNLQNVGKETQQSGVCGAVDRWRGDASAKRAIR